MTLQVGGLVEQSKWGRKGEKRGKNEPWGTV